MKKLIKIIESEIDKLETPEGGCQFSHDEGFNKGANWMFDYLQLLKQPEKIQCMSCEKIITKNEAFVFCEDCSGYKDHVNKKSLLQERCDNDGCTYRNPVTKTCRYIKVGSHCKKYYINV